MIVLIKSRLVRETVQVRQEQKPVRARAIAQDLIKSGKMPTPERFLQAMGKAREEYVPKLKKFREKEKEE